MNETPIKSVVELAGAEYEGLKKGHGAVITDPKTRISLIVPLDYFFIYTTMEAVRLIQSHVLISRLYFSKPKEAA